MTPRQWVPNSDVFLNSGDETPLTMQVLTSLATAYLVLRGVAWPSRLWLYPGIAFAIAFVDSALCGLCTESLVGALCKIQGQELRRTSQKPMTHGCMSSLAGQMPCPALGSGV